MDTDKQLEFREKVIGTLNTCFAIVQNDSNQALTLARKTLTLTRRRADVGMEARTLIVMADVYRFINGSEKNVQSCFQRSENLLPHITNKIDIAYVCRGLGVYYRERGDFISSVSYLNQALIIYKTDERTGVFVSEYSQTLNSMSIVLRYSGNYDTALRYLFEAHHLAKDVHNPVARIKSLINIGTVYGMLKNYDKAIQFFEEGYSLSKKHSDGEGMAFALENTGWSHYEEGRIHEAYTYMNRALPLWRKMKSELNIMRNLQGLGAVLFKKGKYVKSYTVLKEAYQYAERWANKPTMAAVLYTMAEIELKNSNYSVAIENLKKGLEIVEGGIHLHGTYSNHSLLATVYSKMGDYKEAYKHKEIAERLQQELLGVERMKAVTAIEVEEALYESEKKHSELQQRMQSAELAAEQKENELREVTASLTQSQKTLESLRDTLRHHIQTGEDNTKELARSIFEEINKQPKKKNLPVADRYFNSTYHDFITKLHTHYPDLTPTEIKVCILIKLNHPTKQIADLLYCSELTVKTHRTRIRKKLNLGLEQNLQSILLVM